MTAKDGDKAVVAPERVRAGTTTIWVCSRRSATSLPSLAAALLVALSIEWTHAVAAEISVIPRSNVTFVSVKREIAAGDATKFYAAVSKLERATVVLEGPGGLVGEALKIGAEIRARKFSTLAVASTGCYSACGLVWVSGARRHMSSTSRIGFHAAYRAEGGKYMESGVANAEIGSFLTHLGLRIEAIRFFTIAAPTEFLLLTPERARILGIDVIALLDDGRAVTPYYAPTADAYA